MQGSALIFPRLAIVVLLILLTGCGEADSGPVSDKSTPVGRQLAAGDGFDFWVLALSWSPSYCEAEGKEANGQQCGAGRRYSFVVHGLWPQFETGWPEFCRSDRRSGPPAEDVRTLRDLMPSDGLIRHQWRKHGTCSGLAWQDYYATMRAAQQRVKIPAGYDGRQERQAIDPDVVERAFIEANPGLSERAMAVTCDGKRLREVRLCLSKDLSFRPCPEIDQRGCRRDSITMPPAR